MIRTATCSLSVRTALSALVFIAPLFIARVAGAQEACGDKTCPKGFTCEMESSGCPTIDCVGEGCKPCEPSTILACRPGPCSADADCAEGMACADVEDTTCTGSAKPEPTCVEGPCADLPADSSCTTTTHKQCLPRWTLPCTLDADCGAGFSCKEEQQCSSSGSSGSSGSGSSGSGAAEPAPPPRDPVVTCEPSGRMTCEPIRVACTADSQCPSGWTCRDNPEGSCWADSNGNTGCTPADPAKLCFPPFSDLNDGGGFGTSGDGSSAPTKGTENGDPVDGAASSGEQGGCSISGARPGTASDALAWCVALGAALGFGRRARRRAQMP